MHLSIKKTTFIVNTLLILLMGITGYALHELNNAHRKYMSLLDDQQIIVALGEELRTTSRDLTENVRMFATTGDVRYEIMYQKILDQRVGMIPRSGTTTLYPGEKINLLALIEASAITEEELGHIKKAVQLSDALVPYEKEAMELVKGIGTDKDGNHISIEPDLNKAISQVCGPAYVGYTDEIMNEFDLFTTKIRNRFNEEKTKEQNSHNSASLILTLSIIAVFIAVLFSFGYYYIYISKPLAYTTAFAVRVADGDLNSRMTKEYHNEIGILRDKLNIMVDNLRFRVDEVENAMHQALIIAEELEKVSHVITTYSEKLLAEINQAKVGATEQAERIFTTTAAVEEMKAAAQEVAKNADIASDISKNTKKKAQEGEQVVEALLESIQSVQKQSEELKTDMTHLGVHAKAINQIMGVISDIADQTNLLALNAAIEAARAGDAGRGFAVVANEVRKLAEKTMTSTTDVEKAIKSIQQSAEKSISQVELTVKNIDKTTQYALESDSVLHSIVELANSSADQVQVIASCSDQQAGSAEEIAHAMCHAAHIASTTTELMLEAKLALDSLSQQAETLSHLISELKLHDYTR